MLSKCEQKGRKLSTKHQPSLLKKGPLLFLVWWVRLRVKVWVGYVLVWSGTPPFWQLVYLWVPLSFKQVLAFEQWQYLFNKYSLNTYYVQGIGNNDEMVNVTGTFLLSWSSHAAGIGPISGPMNWSRDLGSGVDAAGAPRGCCCWLLPSRSAEPRALGAKRWAEDTSTPRVEVFITLVGHCAV